MRSVRQCCLILALLGVCGSSLPCPLGTAVATVHGVGSAVEPHDPHWWTDAVPGKGWVLWVGDEERKTPIRSPQVGALARIVDDDRVSEDLRGADVKITALLDQQGLVVDVECTATPGRHPITLTSDLLVFTESIPEAKEEHVLPLPILHGIIKEAATDMETVMKLRELSPGFCSVIDDFSELWSSIDVAFPREQSEGGLTKHEAELFYRKCIAYGNPKAALCLALLYHYGYSCQCHRSPW
mmetsp:Transcript_32010/g.76518  ORF Transcript_32010/g.76518 Transcript_32010/m.76518 type:complete len:241 (+) Transcript_32010:87-809(+)